MTLESWSHLGAQLMRPAVPLVQVPVGEGAALLRGLGQVPHPLPLHHHDDSDDGDDDNNDD